MKIQPLSLCLIVALCVLLRTLRRILPSRRENWKLPNTRFVLELPAGPHAPSVDLAKVHQEALDLAQLAQPVPTDVDQVAQGKIPKDLADKLKHIEKLSKSLRGELAP